MRVRGLKPSDIPILNAMATRTKWPYPADLNGPDIEAVVVVVDDADQPMMALVAERIIQGYLYSAEMSAPATMGALEFLHAGAVPVLRRKGYTQLNVFLPPPISERFGRRLERTFRWVRQWPCWAKSF